MSGNSKQLNLDIEQAYYEYKADLYRKRLKIVLVIALFFVTTFGLLDFILYPNVAYKMIITRLSTDVIIIISIIAYNRYSKYSKHIKAMSFLVVMMFCLFIDTLVFISGEGAASPYYAGLTLTIVALSILLPWSFKETILISVAMVFLYLLTTKGHSIIYNTSYNLSLLSNNLFFLVSTSTFCAVASGLNDKLRLKQFCLNYELEEKNKKLAALDEMKSQFFANISHEFRTPLTLILGPIQDVLHGSYKLPDKVASVIDIIQQNALRLLRLVNDLLDLTRLEEGKANIKLKKTEINGLVAGLVDSMTHLAITKEIDLIKRIPDEDSFILADHDAIEKVMLNLLSNAIKFTNKGGKITISSAINQENVIIKVRDSGIGINAKNLPHIFDRFKQVDSSSTRKYQGTGLGLSLVKELTELQDGKIEVQSKPNQGTTFCLIFPIFKEGEEERVVQEISQDELEEPHDDKLSNIHKMTARARNVIPDDDSYYDDDLFDKDAKDKKTILVVDDEPDMRYYITNAMKEQGYNILQASDGKKGLEMARENMPDLIILDLMLPEIDGLEVCKLLKSDKKTNLIKIILLTARSDEKSKMTALKNGADDFINKPFSTTEVTGRIANLLHNQELQQQLYEKNQNLKKTLQDLKQTQSKLIQSEKLNALGNLSAGLLHEVNNPLNYTMTALQLVKMDPAVQEDEDLKDSLADMDEGMTRIKNIVTDLKTFAYPEEVDKQASFLINDAIESVKRFTAHEAKDIKLEIDVDENLEVKASQSHIVQVLINLVTNAIKAINNSDNKNKGEIKIFAHKIEDGVTISVQDNGTGMDEETIAKIFNPFFTTADVGDGMGMGLSICHTIMQSHDTEFEVKSEIGKGTTFSFKLKTD